MEKTINISFMKHSFLMEGKEDPKGMEGNYVPAISHGVDNVRRGN